MTFEELENHLPNGFHDAEIYSLKIDYMARSAIIRIALDFGSLNGPERENYRIGELQISGLFFFSIDPPDPSYPYIPDGCALNVSGDPSKNDTFPELEKLSHTFSSGVSCYRFFVNEWNSFINIAAEEVEIFWISGENEEDRPN